MLHETNDGYHVILDAESLKGKRLQASSTEDERGGTWVKDFSSFREMLLDDGLLGYGGEEDENGNITFESLKGKKRDTLEQVLSRMSEGEDVMVLGGDDDEEDDED